MDVDLDRNFLQLLRELKVLIEKDCLEEHRALMLKAAQGLPERVYMHIDSNFRVEWFWPFTVNSEHGHEVYIILTQLKVKGTSVIDL